MNFLMVISMVSAIGVFAYAVATTKGIDVKTIVDFHAFLIVICGSLAATAVSFQLDRVALMAKVFFHRSILGKKPNYILIIKELMKVAESYRNGKKIEDQIANVSDDFMQESLQVLADNIVDEQQLIRILRNRTFTILQRYNMDVNRFKSMGKYPPAMGLLGAVLGMIALLGGLGQPGAEANIGPAMSIALVATLYGIAVANLVIIPIGENLGEVAQEIKTKNLIIVEGIKLISRKTNPIILAEELNSFLLPKERVDWKSLG